MENIHIDKKICIWGTGKYAQIFWNQFKDYFLIFMKYWKCDLQSKILFWVDSNVELQGNELYGKRIVSPHFFYAQDIDICVIAALNRKEIYDDLEEHGKRYERNYISSEEFIGGLKDYLLSERDTCLKRCGIEEQLKGLCLEQYVKRIRDVIIEVENTLEKKLLFSKLIDKWEEEKDKCFSLFTKNFNGAFVITAFAWYFGNDITEISKWLLCKKNHYIKKQTKQTIGMVLYNYFGGGIEKVVSLLIPLFIEHGHKVVLITDSLEKGKEYPLPKQCNRYVMKYRMQDSPDGRIVELQQCVKDFEIDIMCFHSGYTHISTFYDMWGVKMLNIPIIMELHSFFYPIIMEKKEVSKYYVSMYQVTDKLVVLSETDKKFWEVLGCSCFYIQNPLEYSTIQIKEMQSKRGKKNGKTIVWIGRLVQTPKRVLDVVPIMKKVIEQVPDARLKLIGLASDKRILSELKRLINRNHLEDVIEICDYAPNIDKIYQNADIVLLTSESESFCNVILESKIWGVPLVLYEMPWLELLEDKKGYISVEPKNMGAMSEVIINLLKNEKKREQLAEEARKSIKKYAEYDVYDEWRKLFEQIYNVGGSVERQDQEYSIIIKRLLNGLYNL